jgi:molybdopterin/thiamine biosynthesis adenylyltransferase
MDTEIDGVKHEMKDLNRQIFFFDLEIKRKRKMISKLRNDIEKSKRVAKLKKEINARVGNNEVR